MSEKNNKAGKVAGKLFFGLSLIILAAVLALSVYLSGQGKLISKTLTLYKSGSIDKIEPLLSLFITLGERLWIFWELLTASLLKDV